MKELHYFWKFLFCLRFSCVFWVEIIHWVWVEKLLELLLSLFLCKNFLILFLTVLEIHFQKSLLCTQIMLNHLIPKYLHIFITVFPHNNCLKLKTKFQKFLALDLLQENRPKEVFLIVAPFIELCKHRKTLGREDYYIRDGKGFGEEFVSSLFKLGFLPFLLRDLLFQFLY